MQNIFLIIQARMTSTRLPSKVMLPLCGKSVLEVMIDRLSNFRKDIIIATTDDGSEKPIVEFCKRLGIKYYLGDTQDVLSRYYEAAVKFGAKREDIIIRLTSDCPLIDQEIVLDVLNYYRFGDFDYVSNCEDRTYPRGLDTEIFSFDTLQKVYNSATSFVEREHVSPYISEKEELFKIGEFKDTVNNSKYRLTLDEEDDYKAIKEVYEKLGCRTDFSYKELIEVMKNNPYLYKINSDVEQKIS